MSFRNFINFEELSLVNEVGKVLTKGYSLEKTLSEFLKILYSFWEVEYSFIALSYRSSQTLRIVKAFGLTENEVKRGLFESGEGIVGKVFKYGIPIVLSDLDEKNYLNKTKLKDRLPREITFIAVPIKIGGEFLGVLAIFKKFKTQENLGQGLKILQTLGTFLGIVYKLYQNMEEQEALWEEEKRELTSALEEKYKIEGVIGVSEAIKRVTLLVKKVAPTDLTVLLTGESGTGKSLIAKAIHFLSPRKEKNFITINATAIPETLLEAELFGYEKGAFTGAYNSKKGKFELANGGTIFLDEIGDLPLSLQPKLLKVLQDKEIERLGGEESVKVDVRFITATNKNLKEMIAQGKFREDLYYRINVFPIYLPPLRERKEDIPVLIDHFLNIFNRRYNKRVKITNSVVKILMEYPWPGNVREFENTLERLVILSEDEIRVDYLPSYFYSKKEEISSDTLFEKIELTEKEEIVKALERTGYNKSKAAKLLGYSLRQLDYRIKKFNIQIKKF
ncbi:MAG: sigma 54-interacting transcriptional regulator [Thermodesulfobacteriaceae bacterium]|nr:sigma 54-interacting transcriptional regulator [Thermodesulfobacteriaceae bacterium]MCX8041803.1 sigma 54-interacting transcriptional regulator [Thermodesulfobacteriaceae bacterium]MDW8136179.1 sigma 54-interacting transcriptional regulator [Thermodesulfobacterium sp.]